ncbi:MAG: signal recognition particle receptor subunit alpha [Candidatus Micrarchaeaceae archaeon]
MDLGEGLRKAFAKIRGIEIVDSKSVREVNKEIQKALLSADVELDLTLELTKRVEERVIHKQLPKGISAKDYLFEVLYEEIVNVMGTSYQPEIKPMRIMLLGLYGSGKTTTAAKLARYYQNRGIGAGVICCDLNRPAAFEQLNALASQAGVGFFGIKDEKDVKKIIEKGLLELKNKKVIICDTGGRNALDKDLVDELREIEKHFKPDEKILVISADTGKVAGRQAEAFNKEIGISGVIITKIDGSGKAGGALSAVNKTKAKTLFITTGEKLDAIEPYDSKKFVSKLLGMPDLEGLIETVENAIKSTNIRKEELENVEELDFDTFYKQLKAMNNMGPLRNIFGMMGMPDIPKETLEKAEDKIKKYGAIISSMTKEERKNADLLKEKGRITRIAKGSGTDEKEVRELISDFNKMKKLIKTAMGDRAMKKRFGNLIGR